MTTPFSKPLLIALLLCIAYQSSAQKKSSKPNIIYIMTDDLGYADLSCYGRKDYQTPHLDRLASQGVKFTNAYAAAPVCTPTRVAFMTGRYPARTALGLVEPIEWSAKDSLIGFGPEIPCMATSLKEAGYETFLVGKWHLGFAPQFSPNKNGFDYFFGFNGGGIDYISHKAPRRGAGDLFENENKVETNGYMTDILSNKANELIRRKHEKPFFLSLMFNAPHWPWQAPDDQPYADTVAWTSGGSPAIYAAMMKSLDEAVGSIMKTLEEQKLVDNTVIIFTSDNGGEKFSDMGIYKGKKMQLWEGGIREPAIVRWPGKIKANSTTNQVVTTMDWTATILALAAAKPHPKFPLDGINIMPVLQGKQKEVKRALYWRIFQRQKHKAMRDGKWKWIQDEKGDEYLIDLQTDPSEKVNLKDQNKETFDKLRKKYQEWEASVLTPIPLERKI
ncbi:MAG: sulfatase-like hydrolase/transferase [Chitinophagaceae bacterium]